jgi:hypothetical protein
MNMGAQFRHQWRADSHDTTRAIDEPGQFLYNALGITVRQDGETDISRDKRNLVQYAWLWSIHSGSLLPNILCRRFF